MIKATVSKLDSVERPLWEGEAITVTWGNWSGEFVIQGNANNRACTGIRKCMMKKIKVAIEIEDAGSTRLVWHGHINSADFQPRQSEHMECNLTMSFVGW